MRELVYLTGAEADIDGIWDYTADIWDTTQANAYVRQITLTCVGLANGTVHGRDATDIRSGYRKQAVGSHIIFYQQTPEAVIVMRILHQRMDAASHLGD